MITLIGGTRLFKVLDIEKSISTLSTPDIGLYSGAMGFSIFYSRLFEITKNEAFLLECQKWVDVTLKYVDEYESLSNSFSSGYSGIIWGLDYLRNKGIIEFNESGFFDAAEDIVYEASKAALASGFYDFLHGGLGAIPYAVNNSDTLKSKEYLEKAVQLLGDTVQRDSKGFKWLDLLVTKKMGYNVYNLSLSHGVAGIVSILLKIHSKGIAIDKTSRLIEGAISWLLSNATKNAKMGSICPSWVREDGTQEGMPSRLAWCYGDFGIAWAVWNAGKVFGNDLWKNESIRIIDSLVRRADPLNHQGLDSGFCHGTSGIAFCFKKLYQETKLDSCRERYEFWIGQTLAQAKFENDGIAGYKFYHINDIGSEWKEDYSLLTGVCGVGLVLMEAIDSESNWDNAFLL